MKIMGVGRRCRVPIHAPTPVISSNEAGVQNNFVVRTDESGFYSVVLDPEFSLNRMAASCSSRRKGTVSSALSLPDPSVDLARRDVYLDVPRNRSFSSCIDIFFTQ